MVSDKGGVGAELNNNNNNGSNVRIATYWNTQTGDWVFKDMRILSSLCSPGLVLTDPYDRINLKYWSEVSSPEQ